MAPDWCFAAQFWNDFVFPKLLKSKKYIICPFIDMANHVGMKEDGNVAFEYFAVLSRKE